MKKLIVLILVFTLSLPCLPCFAEQEAAVIYVSPNGSDNGDGSWSKPYLTLEKAVTESRRFTGEKRIRLRGGRYSVTKTTTLNSKDSGLIIENVYGETPELSGAASIPFTALKKSNDPVVMERLIEQAAKDNLMEVYLPDVGITEYGTMKKAGFGISSSYSPTLTYNDKYLTYGEYPNKGYWTTWEIIEPGNNFTFTINNPRYKKWIDAEDVWVLGFFCHDWAESLVPAQIDFETGHISAYSSYTPKANRRVRFFNLLEEIDVPGEFYINRETGYLYIYPPEGMKAGDELRYSTCSSRILSISGASDVTIQGIKFSGTSSQAISASNCPDLLINACEITATGNTAITVSNSKNALISNCFVHDTGGGGISISGGNRTTLTPGNIRVENCRIERFMNYRKTYCPAVSISGVGNTVSHCEISDAPHEAISYSGNNHIIEYCEIYNVCNETADCGAIYTGRDWSTQGHQIRYNYFHDMKLIGTNTGMKNHAVYLDDTHSSTKVYGNVFYKASSVALYGGGRYNTFVNNLMLECDEPFYFDNRGMWWTNDWLQDNNSSVSVYRKLRTYDYKNGVWNEQYPYLANILEDEPKIPKHNVITGNVIYRTPYYSFAQEVYDYGTFENNITIDNTSSFADYKGGDFNILPDSEIKKLIPDFMSVDFNDIGRYAYTLNNKSPAPSVTDILVSGKDSLKVSYTYNGRGYYKSLNTTVNWYVSDLKNGTYTKIASGETLSVTDELTGKYVKAEIIPINCEGVTGAKAFSAPVQAGRGTNSDILKVTGNNNSATVENIWSQPVTLGIFRPSFTENGGLKIMTSLDVSFVTLNPSESTETEGITLTMDTLEPVN